MLTRFLTWLRNLWNRLLGRTPQAEQQRFGGGSGRRRLRPRSAYP